MAVTTVNLSDQVATFVTKTNTISTDLGDIDSLNTSAADLVQAINNIDARSQDSSEIIAIARGALSVEDSGALGLTLSYDSSSGQISLSGGADAATVRSYLVSGTGLDYDSTTGVFSVSTGGIGTTQIADSSVTQVKMAQDAISSSELKDVVTLVIYDAAGTAVKTLYGAGS